MKTIKTTGLAAIVFFFLILVSFNSKAQCGVYSIGSNLSCNATVNVDIYTVSSGSCNYCTSLNGLTVPAAGSIVIPCDPCMMGTVCNIMVTVVDVGGVSVGTGIEACIDTSFCPSFAAFTTCSASGIQYVANISTFKLLR